jgi:hypothetical protein
MHLRSILRAAAAASLVALAACEEGLGPAEPGEIVATWGGEPFTGRATAEMAGSTLLVFGSDMETQFDGKSLILRVRNYHGPDEYFVDTDDAEVRYVIGGDGIGDVYATNRGGAGRVNITTDSDGRIIGSVRFDAVARPGYSNPVGASARFEGNFHAPFD